MSKATKEEILEIFNDDNQVLLMYDNFEEITLEEAWHFIDGANGYMCSKLQDTIFETKEECVGYVLKHILKDCKEIYAEYL